MITGVHEAVSEAVSDVAHPESRSARRGRAAHACREPPSASTRCHRCRLYLAIKSLYWSKGGTLKKILWCDDDSIKPYFIAAGENLTYTNLRRQLSDSLEDEPFPSLPEELQKQIYFEFGSIEDHFKYRQAVMEAYPCGHYPVFEGYNHMQYQIRDPRGFAEMLTSIAEHDGMPKLPFIRK